MEELQIAEYEDVRVVTTKQLAQAYGVQTKILTKNFNNNKKRYIEGKHYFVLEGDELRTRGKIYTSSNRVKKLYLWTERGILLHAKSINTDVAWEAYERLIDFYFQKRKEIRSNFPLIEETTRYKVPLVKGWYERNKGRIKRICLKADITHAELYHHMLERIGEKYDLNAANELYKDEVGYYPTYATDVIKYYPELEKEADYYLDRVEKYLWM